MPQKDKIRLSQKRIDEIMSKKVKAVITNIDDCKKQKRYKNKNGTKVVDIDIERFVPEYSTYQGEKLYGYWEEEFNPDNIHTTITPGKYSFELSK